MTRNLVALVKLDFELAFRSFLGLSGRFSLFSRSGSIRQC